MTGHPFRIFLMCAIVVTGLGAGLSYQVVPTSAVAAFADAKSKDHGRDCVNANPDWKGLAVAVNSDSAPMETGRVFSANDGTLAVLTIVTDVDDDGDTQGVDFAASLSVSAVIIKGSDHRTTIELEPPARRGSGLAADDLSAIQYVVYCYKTRLPVPPATTTAATETPTVAPPASPVATEPATATSTATSTETAVASPVASVEATPSEAPATETATALPTETSTPEPTATVEPSATATEAPTQTVEPTATTVPTEAPSPEATVAPSETAAPIVTETPVASETASPTPTLLYGVPDTEGFDNWTVPAGWAAANGLLNSDGSDFQGYAQPSRLIEQTDYAVEVEIRIVEQPADCGGNLGLVMRGSETGFYAGGIEWVCGSSPTVRLWAYNVLLAEQPITLDQEWVTLRIEAKGDQIRLSVNGTPVAEVTNGTFPTGGQIALWSSRVKVEVRAVRVFAVA